MISDYQPGHLIFFDGDIGKYFYGTILSVEIDRVKNHICMKVLNKNADMRVLVLNYTDKKIMKQWMTEYPLKCSGRITMKHN